MQIEHILVGRIVRTPSLSAFDRANSYAAQNYQRNSEARCNDAHHHERNHTKNRRLIQKVKQ